MSRAVVLFSGGQDSTTCLFWAKQYYDEVKAIAFDYGQKHSIELEQAKEIANIANVELFIYKFNDLSTVNESGLISGGEIKTEKTKDGLPVSFVPNRNQLFITVAHGLAKKLNFDAIILGVSQEDYSGYPDCRLEFIRAIEKATNLGSNSNITIETPLIYKTKAETFKMAERIGVLQLIINETHTCYNGNRELKHEWGYGCGECPACKLRENGYREFKRFS